MDKDLLMERTLNRNGNLLSKACATSEPRANGLDSNQLWNDWPDRDGGYEIYEGPLE